MPDVRTGDSVSVDGVCPDGHPRESRARSPGRSLQENVQGVPSPDQGRGMSELERALRLVIVLEGHLVSGHCVDGSVRILKKEQRQRFAGSFGFGLKESLCAGM